MPKYGVSVCGDCVAAITAGRRFPSVNIHHHNLNISVHDLTTPNQTAVYVPLVLRLPVRINLGQSVDPSYHSHDIPPHRMCYSCRGGLTRESAWLMASHADIRQDCMHQ